MVRHVHVQSVPYNIARSSIHLTVHKTTHKKTGNVNNLEINIIGNKGTNVISIRIYINKVNGCSVDKINMKS
jgi:hypothetical protein